MSEIMNNQLVEKLLDMKPYSLTTEEKKNLFLSSIREAINFHYKNSVEFRKLCDNKAFSPQSDYLLEEIPYLPVSLFKKFHLKSVDEKDIFKTVYSSATTGDSPSIISLDRITSLRQTKALIAIVSSFIHEKKDFIVMDSDDASIGGNDIKSRVSAIRGFIPFMKSINFILNKNLQLDPSKIKNIDFGKTYCIFGFTWLIHNVIEQNMDNREVKTLLTDLKDPYVIHIGGWKKLRDINMSKDKLYQNICDFFHTTNNRIIDIYGMTEQLGTVYPECEYGNKHVPLYSEILIRNTVTLENEGIGKSGFIQLISPLPRSYPGISILSDDLGHIVGIDDCPCGRKGKYFQFDKRSEKAEVKGCGDTIG